MNEQKISSWPEDGLTIPVSPAITFPCNVDGEDLTATLTNVENNYDKYVYYVNFSNGYSAQFFYDFEEGQWIEESIGPTAYAESAGRELGPISKRK